MVSHKLHDHLHSAAVFEHSSPQGTQNAAAVEKENSELLSLPSTRPLKHIHLSLEALDISLAVFKNYLSSVLKAWSSIYFNIT